MVARTWVAGIASAAVAGTAVVGVEAHLPSPTSASASRAATSAGPVPTSGHTPRPPTSFRIVGSGGVVRYPAIGVTTVPLAPTDPPPHLSQDAVLALVTATRLAPAGTPSSAPDSVSLVRYTSVTGDGSRTTAPVTAWAIEYDDVTQAISVPVTFRGSSVSSGWTVMLYVDAATGEVVDSFDFT